MKSPLLEKKVFAWALYDWANSAFATTVMVAFFPVFFKQTLAAGTAATTSTVWFGTANGISSLVLALTAPWLGALADKGSAHVRMLAIFTAVGAVPTALLAFVGTADAFTGLTLFVFRKRLPPARFRTPLHPFSTAIFVLACWLVVIGTVVKEPKNSLIGLLILALGLPFGLRRRR